MCSAEHYTTVYCAVQWHLKLYFNDRNNMFSLSHFVKYQNHFSPKRLRTQLKEFSGLQCPVLSACYYPMLGSFYEQPKVSPTRMALL